MDNDAPDIARQLADVLLRPVQDVGAMLAREIDKTNTELAEIKQHLAGLQNRVDALEAKVL